MAIPATTARGKLESALERLAGAVFTKAEYVNAPLSNQSQIRQALAGKTQMGLTPGDEPNARACEEMGRYLDVQYRTHQQVSLGDLQRHFQQKPYGWRQDDVSLVLATLVGRQKAVVSYTGEPVSARDPRLTALITKQSGFDKVGVRVRKGVPAHLVTGARQLLREVDVRAQVPSDEDGLVQAIVEALVRIRDRCDGLLRRYRGDRAYPGEDVVSKVRREADAMLSGSRDPEAFLRAFNREGDELVDDISDLTQVEGFFSQQKGIFDEAWDTHAQLNAERVYFESDRETMNAVAKMGEILGSASPYGRIHELTSLRKAAMRAYGTVVERTSASVINRIDAAVDDVLRYADSQQSKAKDAIAKIVLEAKQYGQGRRQYAKGESSCTRLDATGSQASTWSKQQIAKVDDAVSLAQRQGEVSVGGRARPSHGPRPSVARRSAPSACLRAMMPWTPTWCACANSSWAPLRSADPRDSIR